MDLIIKLNNQTPYKDKSARTLQYLCRAVYDSLQQNETNVELVEKLKSLEYILSSFRKLLRFGKCLDVFYSSFKSIHYPDAVIRLTLTLSKISQALYLFTDHFLWLYRSGLMRNLNVKKWADASNRYWLFSIIMNLIRDAYEIIRLLKLSDKHLKIPQISSRNFAMASLQTYACLLEHKNVAIDTIKNACDVFIPLTALGYTKMTPRTIGILGVISSLAGLLAVLQPSAKLLPN